MDLNRVNYFAGTSKISSKKQVKEEQNVNSGASKEAKETKLPSYAQVSSIVAGIKCSVKNNINSPVVNSSSPNEQEIQQKKSEEEISKLSFYDCLSPMLKKVMVNMNREDNKNSSNLKLLLNLMENNDADICILNHVSMDSNIEQNMVDDMLLVKKAKDENIPIEDIFVPKYTSKEEALQNSKAGDVYQLNDEKNIYYNDGKNVTQLKMDKEMYLKLFPPIDRFSTKQQRNGDCYLVSTLNSIFQNPETRNHIFDCFEQDGDDVKVKFPKSDKTYTIKNGSLEEHGDLTENQYIRGTAGMKILECVYGDIKRDTYMDFAQSMLDNNADKSVKNLLDIDDVKERNTSRQLAIEQYQRDIEYLESIENKDEQTKKKIDKLKSKVGNLKHRNKTAGNWIKSEKAYEKAAFRAIDIRNNFNNDVKTNADNVYLEKYDADIEKDSDGYVSKVKFIDNSYGNEKKVRLADGEAIKAKYGNNRNYYREGGSPAEIYNLFDMPVREYIRPNISNSETDKKFDYKNLKQEIIANIQEGKTFVLTGATIMNNSDDLRFEKGLINGHGYSMSVELKDDNQLTYKIINPWNTAYNTELSEEEMERYFGRIYLVKQ